MITFVFVLLLGFVLGMRHATDADHVVAITNIVSQQRRIRDAAWTGVWWGIGHSLTVLAAGSAIIGFGLVVPARLGMSLELSVALMLIVLGFMNLNTAFGWFHDPSGAGHGHGKESPQVDCTLRRRALRPALIGFIHGLAGSAAVALLVLPLIRDTGSAIAYLLVFGAGTIAGMMLITAAIAVPVRYAAARSQGWHRLLGGCAGAASCCFGAFLVYQIGFVEKLFLL